jgi:hypothetical protein
LAANKEDELDAAVKREEEKRCGLRARREDRREASLERLGRIAS